MVFENLIFNINWSVLQVLEGRVSDCEELVGVNHGGNACCKLECLKLNFLPLNSNDNGM